MQLRLLVLCIIVTNGWHVEAQVAGAQDYPSRPVRIIAAQAGGSSDFAARVIAPYLSTSLGQQAIVENRGGSAVIALEAVAKAVPDGYTVLIYGSSQWLLPLIQDVNYDPLKDFAPITLANRSPNILVIHPSLPVKSVKELIALAKSKPGELNYASAIAGSANHLAAELFKSMAGVNIVRVPYKGAGTALVDLVGGHVQVMFATTGSVSPHLKSGRLRGLAVTSAEPSIVMPGYPTIASSGLPGYESQTMIAMFAPGGTPAAIVNRLNQETAEILRRPDVKERFLTSGVEAVGNSPEQLIAIIKSEMSRMGKVVKAARIRSD